MALFKMDPHFSWTPETVDVSGAFVVPSNVTTPNTQILPTLLTTGSQGTPFATPTATIFPQGSKGMVFCTPNGSAAANSANAAVLPRGMALGAQLAGSEFMLDLSTLQADIISAQAQIVTMARGTQTSDCVVSLVDNVNKLLYFQVVSWASGAPVAAVVGTMITFQVALKDTFTV